MCKHTPGSWGIRGPRGKDAKFTTMKLPDYVITPPDFGTKPYTELVAFVDDEANARLIASAPDLLAACKAEQMADAWHDSEFIPSADARWLEESFPSEFGGLVLPIRRDEAISRIARARSAAIAKAEGGEP